MPQLEGSAPNQVWTSDISKLATYGVFLNLYLELDLVSRFPVAWMFAERENTALSKQLFAEAITRYKARAGHRHRPQHPRAPMTAIGSSTCSPKLGVERTSPTPASSDNLFSESCFKIVKYQSDCPGRFRDAAHARARFTEFFAWHANRHRRSGLALFTPADVFFGRVPELAATRQHALKRRSTPIQSASCGLRSGSSTLPLKPTRPCSGSSLPNALASPRLWAKLLELSSPLCYWSAPSTLRPEP